MQEKKRSIQLNGTKDDKNNTVDIGLYEILKQIDLAKQNPGRKEYIMPKYVDAGRSSLSFRDRMSSMKRTLTPVNEPK